MRSRFLLILTVAVLLLTGAACGEVRVYFSPQGGCDEALVQVARSAQMHLDAVCYTFSLDPIADELIAARDRGANVRVILDRRRGMQPWSSASHGDAEARGYMPCGNCKR